MQLKWLTTLAVSASSLFWLACTPDLNEDECRMGDPNACAHRPGTVCHPKGWCVEPEIIGTDQAVQPDQGTDEDAATGGTAGGAGGAAGGSGGAVGGSGGAVGGSGGAVGGSGGAVGGSGGAVGGSGGAAGGSGGAAGGSGGEGGSGGALVEANYCQEACEDAEDCLDNFTCTDNRCVPVTPMEPCTDDAGCVAPLSGWITSCAAQADCPGQVCIGLGEGGVCATAPSEQLSCDAMGMASVAHQLFPEGDAVNVCAQDRAICGEQSFCTIICRDDSHCISPDYPSCDVDSGRCVCAVDSCSFNTSVCGDDGVCHCAADADCTEGGVDTCYDGVCGCSEATICPENTANPGTTWVCEPFK